jgi:hypothetical protein
VPDPLDPERRYYVFSTFTNDIGAMQYAVENWRKVAWAMSYRDTVEIYYSIIELSDAYRSGQDIQGIRLVERMRVIRIIDPGMLIAFPTSSGYTQDNRDVDYQNFFRSRMWMMRDSVGGYWLNYLAYHQPSRQIRIYSYPVTARGVGTTPVVSRIPLPADTPRPDSVMVSVTTVSPDSRKVLLTLLTA